MKGIAPSLIAINPSNIDVFPTTLKFSSNTLLLTIYLSKTVANPNPIGGITIANTLPVNGNILSAARPIAIAPAALFIGPPKSYAVHPAIIAVNAIVEPVPKDAITFDNQPFNPPNIGSTK